MHYFEATILACFLQICAYLSNVVLRDTHSLCAPQEQHFPRWATEQVYYIFAHVITQYFA